jgi:hypothetical protein
MWDRYLMKNAIKETSALADTVASAAVETTAGIAGGIVDSAGAIVDSAGALTTSVSTKVFETENPVHDDKA